jgi:hypothetical protein
MVVLDSFFYWIDTAIRTIRGQSSADDINDLNKAVRIYLSATFSGGEEDAKARLIRRFGAECGPVLVREASQIYRELASVEPQSDRPEASLDDALRALHAEADAVANSIGQRHPQLTRPTLRRLSGRFWYWWK